MRYRLKIGEEFDLIEILDKGPFDHLKPDAIGKQFISHTRDKYAEGLLFVPFTHHWEYVDPNRKLCGIRFPRRVVKKIGTFIIKSVK